MQIETNLPATWAGPRPAIDDVRLALVRLQGQGDLIRLRVQRTPGSNQATVLASLDLIQHHVRILADLLDTFERATDG